MRLPAFSMPFYDRQKHQNDPSNLEFELPGLSLKAGYKEVVHNGMCSY